MTRIVNKKLYCENCGKSFVQPVYMSVSSFLLSEEERKKLEEGTLFKNFCPECGKKLIEKGNGNDWWLICEIIC